MSTTLADAFRARCNMWWPDEDVEEPVAQLLSDVQGATPAPQRQPSGAVGKRQSKRDPEAHKAYMKAYMAQRRAQAKAAKGGPAK